MFFEVSTGAFGIVNNKVYISSDVEVDAFYNVYAERKDVDKLEVEIWQ